MLEAEGMSFRRLAVTEADIRRRLRAESTEGGAVLNRGFDGHRPENTTFFKYLNKD